jgi:hypothetical protein
VLSQGIVLKPRLSRGTHTFEFPVLLSNDARSWRVLLGAYLLPPLSVYVAKRHVIRPLRRWHRTRQVSNLSWKPFRSAMQCAYVALHRVILLLRH